MLCVFQFVVYSFKSRSSCIFTTFGQYIVIPVYVLPFLARFLHNVCELNISIKVITIITVTNKNNNNILLNRNMNQKHTHTHHTKCKIEYITCAYLFYICMYVWYGFFSLLLIDDTTLWISHRCFHLDAALCVSIVSLPACFIRLSFLLMPFYHTNKFYLKYFLMMMIIIMMVWIASDLIFRLELFAFLHSCSTSWMFCWSTKACIFMNNLLK